MDVRICILKTLVKFSDFQSGNSLKSINFSFIFNLPGTESFVIIISHSLLFLKKFLDVGKDLPLIACYQSYCQLYRRNGINLIFFKLPRNFPSMPEPLNTNNRDNRFVSFRNFFSSSIRIVSCNFDSLQILYSSHRQFQH